MRRLQSCFWVCLLGWPRLADAASAAPVRRLQAERPQLTEEQKAEIREAFDLFDAEKTGKLDYYELKTAMRALGFPVRKAEVQALIKDNDRDGSDRIAYDDFLSISA